MSTWNAKLTAQTLQAPAASGQNAGSTAGSTANGSFAGVDGTVSPIAGTRGSLSAGQIVAILQDKPEVIVEIKQLAADQLQQQGVKIQPDSITDEALYSQIASNAPLRSAITNFLRARGYVSDADLQQNAAAGGSDRDDDGDALSSTQTLQSLSQVPGANLPLAAADGSSLQDSLAQQAEQGRLQSSGNTTGAGARTTNAAASRQTRDSDTHNTTDVPKVLRQPAPYNLLSMRDLYTQIPEESTHLKRFGSEMFVSRGGTGTMTRAVGQGQESPLDIPIGPDYVVGPGDSLSIDLWGGISQTLTKTIDREGRISLPEAGTIAVAGLTLERAQAVIGNTLKAQYRNAQVAVTVSRLRTVRVYVVGDVQRPGAYDISSLSTPLNALYAAGGPTGVGSLRTLRHMRGKELVAEIDLYDFLLHGVRTGDDRFQGGDTLLVPPAGPQVALSGAVKRPAIYELKHEATLAAVLADAGGSTVAAALSHITVERIDANQHRETVTLNLTKSSTGEAATAAISDFPVRDGDRIQIAPILPFSERAVYLEGHVVRPGRMAYREGMHLNDVLRSYQDLLPEPAAQGEVIRLVAPDLHAETIEFNVADALIGNVSLELQPFDTIRVLGRYDVDSPRVEIRGEVLRPGSFPLSEGMTAAQLVRMAGGFRRGALQQDADLTSYHIVDGNKVIGQRSAIRIGDAVARNDSSADVVLKPGDILTVHQITGWNDIGASLTIEGEANHPGSYGFQEGERLSSVLRRAGGLRDTAYPAGAVLIREQVRELEEKSRAELIHQIETSSAAAKLAPNLSGGDSSATLQLIQQQQEQVLARLRSQPSSGRLVIHINSDIDSWANTDADIEVRRGDVLSIPKRPGFVLISGQVYNASAITYVPGKTAGWYLQRAGGSSELADRKEIFVIRANGLVVGRHSGDGHVLSAKLDAGDVVVVPQKIIGTSQFWRNLLTVAQIASSAAIAAAVAGL
ncbi:SLBB domain-containing protein [Granulicella tundricola]|uniref:SLBB domain-containing protein n=1 Tax=Granulicella tundricola TaxID=940615 RepID=UPI00031AD83C|nr:SLBB domain-containing protein [Granulicella tundricola]